MEYETDTKLQLEDPGFPANTTFVVYGYEFYLFGRLVARSKTLYTYSAEVWKELRETVLDICENIHEEDKSGLFHWCHEFDPEYPDEFEDGQVCLRNYNCVQRLVGNSTEEYADPCPFELSLNITEYVVRASFEPWM